MYVPVAVVHIGVGTVIALALTLSLSLVRGGSERHATLIAIVCHIRSAPRHQEGHHVAKPRCGCINRRVDGRSKIRQKLIHYVRKQNQRTK